MMTPDDLSCITIDSLKHIDNEKVKNIWQGMAKLKRQEGDYYEQLAGMVDEMTPEVVYQSVQATPRPSTNVPTCADELLEELGSAELFKRVLAIGYMDWQGFEKNRRKTFGGEIQAQYRPRGCYKIRHFHFKADGSQMRCSHQQRRHPAQ